MRTNNENRKKSHCVSIAFGLLVGVVDAVLDFYFFYEGTFWELLIYDVPKHEVYIRSVILASFIIFGIIAATIMAQRKKAEEKLRESEAQLAESNQLMAGVLEHTHMMAVFLDPQFNFIWVNCTYADTCRYKPSFFPGKNHFDLYPNEENQEIFQRVIDTGEPFLVEAKSFEFLDQPERGVTCWDWSLIPVKDGTGKVTGLVFTLAEVTERKQAEEELRVTNERLELAMDAGEHGFWDWNIDTNEVFFSPRYYTMLGYENKELPMVLDTWINLMHPEDRETIVPEVQKYAENAEPYEIEFRLKCKDGSWKWISGRGKSFELDENGVSHRAVGLHVDITERKRADELLQKSEEKYRLLAENASDVIWTRDMNLNLTYLSPSIEELTGYSVEESIALPNSERMTPASMELMANIFEEELKLEAQGDADPSRARTIETEMICKDGSTVWIEVTVKFIRNQTGQAVRMLGISRDFTERKQAEESLRESEATLKSIFRAAPTGIGMVVDRVIKQANDRLCEMTGYSREELLEKNARILYLTDEDFEYVGQEKYKQISERGTGTVETRWQRKDGKVIDILLSSTPIDLYDLSVGVTFAALDITERKQAEKALRESEEKYRTIFENIQDVYYEANIDGTILEISPSVENASQYSRNELVGKSLYDIYTNSEERDELLKLILDKGKVNDFEITLTDKDGSQRPCSISTLLIRDEQDNPIKFVGTMRDIAERKRLETQLLQSQKMESSGTLAGGIAHDFNNILTTILGNISLAKDQVTPDDEIFDLLNETKMASTRAQTLTKQLLTFAKGGTPIKETASIKVILKESSLFVLRGSKSSCEFSMAKDLWSAEVDVGQINQVINNIVINANQAMPKGGTIQVAAENLIIEARHDFPIKPGRYIRISIKDQGVGIAEDHLLNIFDPYFTTKYEGSGLGLATTYSIIKKHDGHITAESQLGFGTTFHIYLPASEKAVPEKEEVKLIKGQGRILVMDDEASLMKVVGRMLGNLGYESEFATDGAEAIRMYKEAQESEKPFDAVILDLTVPGKMGGKKCITKLLQIDPEVKAIVSSGYSDDPVLSIFQEYGFKGMMPKPFESRSLGKVLHEVLKGKGKD